MCYLYFERDATIDKFTSHSACQVCGFDAQDNHSTNAYPIDGFEQSPAKAQYFRQHFHGYVQLKKQPGCISPFRLDQ